MTSLSRTALLALALAGCAEPQKKPETAAMTSAPPAATPAAPAAAPPVAEANPLLAPWRGPWGGVPPFGKFKVAEIQKAMEDGMAQNLADIDRIASDPAPATYENTVVALEIA